MKRDKQCHRRCVLVTNKPLTTFPVGLATLRRMHAAMRQGRRGSPRAPIAVPAQVPIGLDRFSAKVTQISEGGLRLECERDIPKGRLVVAFDLPGFGPQRVGAEIWWQQQKATPLRFGCAFKELSPATQTNITTYVKKMKQSCSDLQFALAMSKPRSAWDKLAREIGIGHLTDRDQIKEFLQHAVEALQSNSR